MRGKNTKKKRESPSSPHVFAYSSTFAPSWCDSMWEKYKKNAAESAESVAESAESAALFPGIATSSEIIWEVSYHTAHHTPTSKSSPVQEQHAATQKQVRTPNRHRPYRRFCSQNGQKMFPTITATQKPARKTWPIAIIS